MKPHNLVLLFGYFFSLGLNANSHAVAGSCVTDKSPWINQILEEQKAHAEESSVLSDSPSHSHEKSGDFQIKWSGAEHKQLGDMGFLKACLQSGLNVDACKRNQIHRADKKLFMSYGQIVSLGDFYLDPEEAFLETKRSSSIGKLFRCIDKEGKVHETQREYPEVDYPDCTWVNILHGGDYLKVVSSNYDHFAWDNMKAYVKYHQRALLLAQAAYRARNDKDSYVEGLLLNKALYVNAFADHFLTDAFPAGHLRVPRKEIKQWAKRKIGGLLYSYIGDALSMILHDNEGKDFSNQEKGLSVRNSLGVDWVTRSDKNLNVCSQDSDPHVQMPLQAVIQSVREVLATYVSGELPEGIFAAAWYVPFPNDLGIVDRWQFLLSSPQGRDQVRFMRDQLPLPLQWIVRTRYIRELFSELPEVLSTFRDRVAKDSAIESDLHLRLPSQYIEEFKNLN